MVIVNQKAVVAVYQSCDGLCFVLAFHFKYLHKKIIIIIRRHAHIFIYSLLYSVSWLMFINNQTNWYIFRHFFFLGGGSRKSISSSLPNHNSIIWWAMIINSLLQEWHTGEYNHGYPLAPLLKLDYHYQMLLFFWSTDLLWYFFLLVYIASI